MTSTFLNLYIENLSKLSIELKQNKKSIQREINKIQKLTSGIRQTFNELVKVMIKKRKLSRFDETTRYYDIIRFSFPIREIRKCEDEKRTLTRESCNILDKYFASLGEAVKKAQSNPVDTDDAAKLAEILGFIKHRLNKSVEARDVVAVHVIKKMDDPAKRDKGDQKSTDTSEGDEKNTDYFSKVEKFKNLALLPVDNRQAFVDEMDIIFAVLKERYVEKLEAQSNSVPSNSPYTEEVKSDDENEVYCYCRQWQNTQMVQCDNRKCKTKWYHFECIALCVTPEGTWICPQCTIFGHDTN